MKITVSNLAIGIDMLMGGASINERIREFILANYRERRHTSIKGIVSIVDDILAESAIDPSIIPLGFKNDVSEWYEFICEKYGMPPSVTDVISFIEGMITESIALMTSSLSYDNMIERDYVIDMMDGYGDMVDLVEMVSEALMEQNPDIISSTVSIIYRVMGLTVLFNKHDAVFVDEEDIGFPATESIYGDEDFVLGAQIPLFRTRASDLLWMDSTIKYLEGVFMDGNN